MAVVMGLHALRSPLRLPTSIQMCQFFIVASSRSLNIEVSSLLCITCKLLVTRLLIVVEDMKFERTTISLHNPLQRRECQLLAVDIFRNIMKPSHLITVTIRLSPQYPNPHGETSA